MAVLIIPCVAEACEAIPEPGYCGGSGVSGMASQASATQGMMSTAMIVTRQNRAVISQT